MPKQITKYASIGKTVGIVAAYPYGTTDNLSGNADYAKLAALQLNAIKLDMDNSLLG